MANQQLIPTRAWTIETVPLLAVILITVHVFAVVYWIYKLATQKPPKRLKKH